MEHTLAELAALTGAGAQGDPQVMVSRVRPFDDAGPGDITLAMESGLRSRIADSRASAFVVSTGEGLGEAPLLVHPHPKLIFARLIQIFAAAPPSEPHISADFSYECGTRLGAGLRIHPRVTVGRECRIGDRVTLHSGVVIGDRVQIGDDSVIRPNVTIYSDVSIGQRVLIHAGTVIGADGFGFVPDEDGHQVKLLQTGRVDIEDDVEIGANCCIDRATFGSTRIRRGAKIDNLVQVAHNCAIGEDTVIASLTGFSGGTQVGRCTIIAGSVGTNPQVRIGDRVIVMGQAGVTRDVPDGQRVAGTPARDERSWKRAVAIFYRLPELLQRLQALEREVSGQRSVAGGQEEGSKR
ncbi:MAG: UDP-3-O-(3-hydroxymyristoyl)glucosamine N-acyltransferase [Acidobacteria bacterium]|nr:UDP-3-O-(3-hydroxymyristoyl)glucosamine N-acyltransferase [Acidobacteriota bacterium]